MALAIAVAGLREKLRAALRDCRIDYEAAQRPISDTQVDVVRSLAKDLGTLLHSHCTKLSLAAKPPITDSAVITILTDLNKLLPAFVALCGKLDPAAHGLALCDKISALTRYALTGLDKLLQAIIQPGAEDRLSSTGILWDSCLDLQRLPDITKLISLKLQECCAMMNDAVEDLRAWTLDETDHNLDEMAEYGNDSSDEEHPAASISSASSVHENNRSSIADGFILKLQRTQLLFKAIEIRRLALAITISQLNDIYKDLKAIQIEVDDIAGEIQEGADEAFIGELEKAFVHRIEHILLTTATDDASKWTDWSKNFKSQWLEIKPSAVQKTIQVYPSPPTYLEFLNNNLRPLRPCMIDGLTDDWQCSKTWIREGRIDYGYLSQHFGSNLACVTRSDGVVEDIPFKDFLANMQEGAQDYARDMHFVRDFPNLKFYTCPDLFKDDWLNFKLDEDSKDDYRFVYVGGNGTRTNLHKDVIASHSWSSNITGAKKWTLIPPEVSHFLRSKDGTYPPNLDDFSNWPNIGKVREAAITVLQQPGQTIFVPSSWYHIVENIGPTISVNHNWLNSVSLPSVFTNLKHETDLSEAAISDLKRDGILTDRAFVTGPLQEITLLNAGMNWHGLFSIILYRLTHEEDYIDASLRPDAAFEAEMIRSVCRDWLALPDSQYLDDVNAMVLRIMQLIP